MVDPGLGFEREDLKGRKNVKAWETSETGRRGFSMVRGGLARRSLGGGGRPRPHHSPLIRVHLRPSVVAPSRSGSEAPYDRAPEIPWSPLASYKGRLAPGLLSPRFHSLGSFPMQRWLGIAVCFRSQLLWNQNYHDGVSK